MIKPSARGLSDASPGDPADTPGSGAENVSSGSEAGELADVIGRRLKALFETVAAEPIPDTIRQLLDELERKTGKTSETDKTGETDKTR